MTHVQVWNPAGDEMRFTSSTSMRDVVTQAAQDKQPLLVYNSSEVINEWDLGTQLRFLKEQIAQLEYLHGQTHVRQLWNVATHVVKVSVGAKMLRESRSMRFHELAPDNKDLIAFAAAMGAAPAQVARAADDIITRRNRAVHPDDIEHLDDDVAEMVGIINPALEKVAKWECLVIMRCEHIKAAFPLCFAVA